MSLAEEADAFCSQLQRRQIKGSLATAKRTAIFLRLLITSRRHSDAQALLDDVRLWGTKLQTAKPFSERTPLHTVEFMQLSAFGGHPPPQSFVRCVFACRASSV